MQFNRSQSIYVHISHNVNTDKITNVSVDRIKTGITKVQPYAHNGSQNRSISPPPTAQSEASDQFSLNPHTESENQSNLLSTTESTDTTHRSTSAVQQRSTKRQLSTITQPYLEDFKVTKK